MKSSVKRIKKKVFLIDDVWYPISEFLEECDLLSVIRLNKSIHAIVTSDYSWKRRCSRQFFPDQISKVKEWFPDYPMSEVFKFLKTEFIAKVNEHNPTTRVDKFYDYLDETFDATFEDPVFELTAISYGFQVLKIESACEFRSRKVSLHLRDWFNDSQFGSSFLYSPEIQISKQNVANEPPDGKIHYPGRDIRIRFGMYNFSFFVPDDNTDLWGLESCVFLCDYHSHTHSSRNVKSEEPLIFSTIIDYIVYEFNNVPFNNVIMNLGGPNEVTVNVGRGVYRLPQYVNMNVPKSTDFEEEEEEEEDRNLDYFCLDTRDYRNILANQNSKMWNLCQVDVFEKHNLSKRKSVKDDHNNNNNSNSLLFHGKKKKKKKSRKRYTFRLVCQYLDDKTSSEGTLILEVQNKENLDDKNHFGNARDVDMDVIFYFGSFAFERESDEVKKSLKMIIGDENDHEENGEEEEEEMKERKKKKEKLGFDVCGTFLGDYIAFSFGHRQKRKSLFYLGGKVLEGGKVTGIMFDPKKQHDEIHGIFTLFPV